MSNTSNKVHQITRMAILVAIIFLLAFTPLGFLTIGPIAATTIQMPVIIGAALMGPVSGAILGGFFGLSALVKVLTMPGADPFSTLALAHAPLAYLIVCLGSVVRYGVTGLIGSALNTVFFLGLLWGLCAETISAYYGVDLSGVGALVLGTAYAAGIPEALVSCVVVAAVCKALERIGARRWASGLTA